MQTQQQWQAPPATPKHPPVQDPRNGYGIAALTLGIVSSLAGFATIAVGAAVGLPAGIAGVGFGVAAWRRIHHRDADNRAVTVIGIVLAAIGIMFGLYAAAVWVNAAA